MSDDVPKLQITQLLCPERHALIAVPWMPGDEPPTLETMLAVCDAAGFNPWCGLCGNGDLHIEHGQTRFTSLEEGLPVLLEVERKNKESAELLRNIRELGRMKPPQ